MMRVLLIRGMLVGVLAGLLSFGVARVLGEPPVDRAIAYEEQMVAGHVAEPARPAITMARPPRPCMTMAPPRNR